MSRKALPVVLTFSLLTFTSAHAQSHQISSPLDQYVQQASEFSSRARANVYFPNPQSIFKGAQFSFINVGTGNLTFLRRDMVASGRVPIVLARVYDSSSGGSVEFGPGWRLSAAETISIQSGKAHLLTENGSEIVFVETGDSRLQLEKDYPSDYLELRRMAPEIFIASLRTGLTKEFKLIGKEFRLTKVTDRNGNELRLLYQNGLLSRLENANHAITLFRSRNGRVFLAQDDQGRQVGFKYDEKWRLIEADDRGGNAWKYSYVDGGKLRTASDPLQRLNFSVAFDGQGRVETLALPSGSVEYRYDSAGRSTTVVDRKQLTSRFFQNEEGVTTRIVNALSEETEISLDAGHNVISLARNGSVTDLMQYDQEHHVISRHSLSNSGAIDRKYSYFGANGLLRSIQASNGGTQSFEYDLSGNVINALLPDGQHEFTYSSRGDLSGFSVPATHLKFTSDTDGLIASMSQGKGITTEFSYAPGGELSDAAFPNGTRAKYDYQPSGLRSKMVYQGGGRVEYSYDPAGNLVSTKVFDGKSRQINGQNLETNDSYQLVRWVLFDGTETTFQYDPKGNLTEIKKGGATTQFTYDALDRLTAVITPDGQRLTYSYQPGERSLIEQYEHANVTVADLWDTGLTFTSTLDAIAVRPLNVSLGSVRFSETLGTFQMANAEGAEIMRPNETLESALAKLHLYQSGLTQKALQSGFSAPFNTMFMPAEYVTVNCCPDCYYDGDGWYCPPCGPPPPPPPSVTISCDTTDLGFGPDPRFGSFSENGRCNTQVANAGGTYTFTATAALSITNNNDGTASYTPANPSQNKQDSSITVTYADPTGGSVSATFPGITVHKPTSLSTNSTTPNDHTIACNLPCLAQPNSGSCNVTPNTSCSYQEPLTVRKYSILDQFGQAFESVQLGSAGTITEEVNAQQGTCSGNQVVTSATGGSPFQDEFGKCDSCCESGGPGCQSTAQQTILVNGFAVRSESITVTCQQATLVP
jgi:YD repeat-containing protein